MQKNTILWADDDADDLHLIKEILAKKKHDFSIVEVSNGVEVLEYLDEAHQKKALPGMVILDINMPVLDGKATLLKIKKNEAYSPIQLIVFTTSQSESDKEFCKKHEVKMITKPSSFQKLEKVLDSILSLLLV